MSDFSVINNLDSIADFLKTFFPDCTFTKQIIPLNPQPNSFSIRIQKNVRNKETAGHSLIEREFQIVYFGSDIVDTLEKIDRLDRIIDQNRVLIPIKGSDRYMRVEDFMYSEPVKSENDVDMVLGILMGELREGFVNDNSPKITNFNVNIY